MRITLAVRAFTGKTTHIATLMKDQGAVLALDRTAAKAKRVEELAAMMGLTCIRALGWDGNKTLRHGEESVTRNGMYVPCFKNVLRKLCFMALRSFFTIRIHACVRERKS